MNNNWTLVGVFLLVLFILALIGCVETVDRGKCLKSHENTVIIPMRITRINRITHVHPQQIIRTTVCDKWEFPEGRPKK